MSTKTTKAKFKAGDRPEVFPAITVDFKNNRGEDCDIKAVFKYRTREEFASYVAKSFANDGELPRADDGQIDFEAIAKRSTNSDAAYLKDAIRSWDLDDELTLDVLQLVCSGQPGAMVALKQAYAAACNEGRLGNSAR